MSELVLSLPNAISYVKPKPLVKTAFIDIIGLP